MKKILSLIILIAIVIGLYQTKTIMQNTSQAYLYGYPIVLMDETRKSMQAGYPETHKRVNQFTHIQIFPDHNFRNVVRPNVDTLYSIAWLDLSNEPVILSVPDMHNRYYVMPFMDAWTNVFASIGTRETGSQAGKYLIAGPNWTQSSKYSLPIIQAPTNMLWLIGRIQTNDSSDIPNVAKLQSGFSLSTLSSFETKQTPVAYQQVKHENNSDINPYEIIDQLSAQEFINTLQTHITTQGTPIEDQAVLDQLQSLGLDLSAESNTYTSNPIKSWLMNKAIKITKNKINERLADRSMHENGWMVKRSGIGRYGTDYPIRTAVAKIGLGALTPEEAVYPNATVDSDNKILSGQHEYTIHFPAGGLPPVDAFWSLTMYDKNGFLIESSNNRYAIGDRDDLEFNPDGSLDILIQHNKPQQLTRNWLPTPSDQFAVTLRMYLPKEKFVQGEWTLPPITRTTK